MKTELLKLILLSLAVLSLNNHQSGVSNSAGFTDLAEIHRIQNLITLNDNPVIWPGLYLELILRITLG